MTNFNTNELYKYENYVYDNDDVITLNLIDIDIFNNTVTCEITYRGRLKPASFDLYTNKNGNYFVYMLGANTHQVYIDDFTYMED